MRSSLLHGEATFIVVSLLIFTASTTLTCFACMSMSGMGDASMVWMRMPGQSWTGAAASFLLMWDVMMVAMMLPSLVPMLRRYRRAVGPAGEGRLGRLTLAAGAGYFFVWTLLGAAVFPLGAMLAAAQPHLPARAATAATGAALFIAGALQFSRWKAHHLACCREAPGCCVIPAADIPTAWRHGVRLGRHCCRCCAGLTAILLVAGVMDLRVMSAITAASTIERLAPAGEHVARSIGAVVLAAALLLMVHG